MRTPALRGLLPGAAASVEEEEGGERGRRRRSGTFAIDADLARFDVVRVDGGAGGGAGGGRGAPPPPPPRRPERKVDRKWYAARHDEILTALIDDALRNKDEGDDEGGDDGEGGGDDEGGGDGPAAGRSPGGTAAADAPPVPSAPSAGAAAAPPPAPPPSAAPAVKRHRPPIRLASGKWKRMRRGGTSDADGAPPPSPTPSRAKKASAPSSPGAGAPSPSSSSPGDEAAGSSGEGRGRRRLPADYFRADCVLRKEKGSKTDKRGGTAATRDDDGGAPPSATGKDETLAKLREKLRAVADARGGKLGKAAEMLRSDAVTFVVRSPSAGRGRGEGGGEGKDGRTAEEAETEAEAEEDDDKVETRSMLKLRMGFVSMSYGILLRWRRADKLVDLVVLRKMCREDFLAGKEHVDRDGGREGNPSNAKSAWRSVSAASLTSLLDDAEGEPSPPPPSPKEPEPVSTPPETPEPKSDDDGGGSKEEEEEETPGHYSEATSMMPAFPSYPPNPFAWILDRNLFTGPSRPKSYLAVSVLGVKNLHDGCEACRRRKPPGTSWSSLLSGLDPSKQKRGYTTRPYVRFVLGDHEHRTKITKFNGGNPSWKRRHRKSCLLPCPPEKNLWWFLGQEDQDLVVEVRNDWKRLPRKGDGAEADGGDEGDGGDPVLAAATVPLSSVTIDKDDRARAGEGREFGRRRRVRSVRRNRAAAAKKDGGASSTRVTLPLRMRGCDRAPEGSVTLKITVREDESSSARRVPDDAPERLKKTVSFQRVKSSFRSNVSKIAGGHNPLRWSRKFDYRTRKWCALKPSSSRSSSASASLVSSSDESSYGYESSSDSISSSDSSSDSSEFRSRLFLKESSSEESYLLPL